MFFNTTKFYTISFFCKHNFFIDEIETYAMNVQKQPPEVFCKKMCSWKFHKIHWKTLVPEAFLNKVAGPRLATLLKKRLWYRCFPVTFVKFLRTPFYKEHICWLLLGFCAPILMWLSLISNFVENTYFADNLKAVETRD